MAIKTDVKEAQKDLKDLKREIIKDSNSVYLLKKEKNKYFALSLFLLGFFSTFILIFGYNIGIKIRNIEENTKIIETKLDSMINADDGNIPLLDKFGDIVYANQLSTRKRYCLGYGNNNNSYNVGQFIVYDNLCLASPTSQSNFKSSKEVVK